MRASAKHRNTVLVSSSIPKSSESHCGAEAVAVHEVNPCFYTEMFVCIGLCVGGHDQNLCVCLH